MKNTFEAFLRGVAWGVGCGCFAPIAVLVLASLTYRNEWNLSESGGNVVNVYTVFFFAIAALGGGIIGAINCAIDNANPSRFPPPKTESEDEDEPPTSKP